MHTNTLIVFRWWQHFKEGNIKVVDEAITAVIDISIEKANKLLEKDTRHYGNCLPV